jgi:hypothetical protein
LYNIFGIGERAEEPVREIDQLTPLAHDLAQARIGPALSWLGLAGHRVTTPSVATALTSSTR